MTLVERALDFGRGWAKGHPERAETWQPRHAEQCRRAWLLCDLGAPGPQGDTEWALAEALEELAVASARIAWAERRRG